MDKKNQKKLIGKSFIYLLILTILISLSFAIPTGPLITHLSNETSLNTGIGTPRLNDPGGYIFTLLLNTTQQNFGWKAYVGNISGKLVLEDAQNYSIYDWDMANPSAEVYISRNQTVDWTTVNCSNMTHMQSEDTNVSKDPADIDSINKTFNVTGKHKSFLVAGRSIQNSSCPTIATYADANETKQTNGENNIFQEILLKDGANNLIYTTIVENNLRGFDNNSYDFQAIVADDPTTAVTGYYFYVELG